MSQTAQDLRAAADVIHRLGWQRGSFQRRPGGPVCMMGAVLAVVRYDDNVCHRNGLNATESARWTNAWEALHGALDGSSPQLWNDWYARDADEVVHLLKTTAEACEL